MQGKEFCAALVFFIATACAASGLGQEARSNASEPSKAGATTASKSDPARSFARLAGRVLNGSDAVETELAELARHPELRELITASPDGRYRVKQLTLVKGDEIRALSVALHAPHDMFLIRGTETGGVFKGMYYVVDDTGFLQGAASRDGGTVSAVSRADVWQGYEQEKAFWMWQAEQIASPSDAPRR